MYDKKTNILIVDDDKLFVAEAKEMLKTVGDVYFDEGYSEDDFYRLFAPGKYNAVILDLRLDSGYEGMVLLEYALNEDPSAPIIVMTGYASISTAVKSLKLGAKDYLEKQYLKEKRFKTEFLKKVNHLVIEDKARKMAEKLTAESAAENRIFGDDIKIKRILSLAGTFAEAKESPILLVGEIGTEKEFLARYIHKKSGARGRFVKKVVAKGEKNLIPLFFGDDKSEGLIKSARAGVLYLENVFQMDFETQQRLLDFINTGKLRKIGTKQEQTVKTQILLASHKSSEELLKNKNMCSDFYYRVKTPELLIPPLRERGDDIILLASYYLEKLRQSGKFPVSSISPEAQETLKAYPWPGNLTELEHVIQLCAVNARLGNENVIRPGHLPISIQTRDTDLGGSGTIHLDKILAEMTLKYMKAALEKSGGAKLEAYKYLGYPESKRGTLNTRFQKFFKTYPDLAQNYPGIFKLYCEQKGGGAC